MENIHPIPINIAFKKHTKWNSSHLNAHQVPIRSNSPSIARWKPQSHRCSHDFSRDIPSQNSQKNKSFSYQTVKQKVFSSKDKIRITTQEKNKSNNFKYSIKWKKCHANRGLMVKLPIDKPKKPMKNNQFVCQKLENYVHTALQTSSKVNKNNSNYFKNWNSQHLKAHQNYEGENLFIASRQRAQQGQRRYSFGINLEKFWKPPSSGGWLVPYSNKSFYI